MLIDKIDSILPQTQCGKCGFKGCRPYAKAIVEGLAEINQCPPGNEEGIKKIADLLGIKPKPLNISHGLPKPKSIARIDEETCIGCTFCIQVCPVDAIVGAPKRLHTVISSECTGCELCVTPCPVDCINIIPLKKEINSKNIGPYLSNNKTLKNENNLKKKFADHARMRYERRLKRLEYERNIKTEKLTKQINKIKSFDYISLIKSSLKEKQPNKSE